MSKIFLHLGAHKTATSFLQANVTANAAAFEKQGWRVIDFQKEFDKLRKYTGKIRGNRPLDEAGEKRLGRFFKEVRNDSRDVFLSYEGFLGSMNMARGKIYPNHQRPIKMLKKRFANRNVQIGFCVRNFADQVESSYNFRFATGHKEPFAEYSKNIEPANLSWVAIIQNLSKAFGAENLVLWTYEDFKKDGAAALPKIVQSAGIDATDLKVVFPKPRNVSLSIGQLKLLQDWHEALQQRLTVSPNEVKMVNYRLRKLLKILPRESDTKGLLEPEKRNAFTEHYEREVALIRERWGKQMLNFEQASLPEMPSTPQEPTSEIA
ncbi:MAG: sulfotransferase domain-containing protein [Rhizomicrobium sp.]